MPSTVPQSYSLMITSCATSTRSTGEIARVRGLQRGVGQSLTGAVRGDEVFQHGEAFAEVRRDRRLDDLARRLGHQAAHSGELADLLFRSASAGVGHDVNRVELAGLVVLLHGGEHFVGHLFGDGRPDFDDLVVTLAVGDGAVQVLLLHGDGGLLGLLHQSRLALGDDHVVDADRQARLGGVMEAELLDAVEQPHRGLQTEAQVAVVDQVAAALLLQQAVDVRHVRSAALYVIVHDCAAHGGRDVLPLEHRRLGVAHVLIVVRGGEVDDLAGVAQTNRRERFHFAGFLGENNFVNVGEGSAFTLGARLAFGQVVDSEHHVLRGHGDRLA